MSSQWPVLMTGHNGFIGRAVVQKLQHEGVEWMPFAGNVLAPADFDNSNNVGQYSIWQE